MLIEQLCIISLLVHILLPYLSLSLARFILVPLVIGRDRILYHQKPYSLILWVSELLIDIAS